MPVHDEDGRRWVEVECLVPGTPEQVWHAIATGRGMSAWFTPTSVDERVGGALEFDFGGGETQHGVITGWEPPVRLTYEEHDWSATGSPGPLATEVTVISRSGDRCVVRMVHSLFTDSTDWDDELESFEGGWPGFLEVLGWYLRDFAGAPAASSRVMAPCPGGAGAGWARLSAALHLTGLEVDGGYRSPAGVPHLHGTVERINHSRDMREVVLRLDEPTAGLAIIGLFAAGDLARAMVSLYLYGDEAEPVAAVQQKAWAAWLPQILDREPVAT